LTLTDRALDFCRFAPGAHLLDVGCGSGVTVEHLCNRYGFSARGVDISPTLIAEGLGRNPALALGEATAEALPFAGKSRDGILCECVLSLLDEPLRALAEFRRVLRSNGYLILSDMYTRDTKARGRIEGWLSECGFETLFWEDHTHFLKELAARLILAHGSLEGLCCTTSSEGGKPGYYLLVARKV
jgi:ubiquinone/menaquinone biosynthesis C-methylase UbiE